MQGNRLSKKFSWVLGVIACIGLWFNLTIPALANQEMYQSALLISSEPNIPLAIYPDPSFEQVALGHGEVGDEILLLEQIYNNQGDLCDRVRLLKAPQLEGWIADVYVKREPSENHIKNPYEQTNQSYSQENYSQGNFVQHHNYDEDEPSN